MKYVLILRNITFLYFFFIPGYVFVLKYKGISHTYLLS